MRRPVALVLLFALAETAAAQAVHVVGTRAGPGVEFTSVQAAVDAAANRDVVLLLPGDHGGPVTVGKSLVLLGVPAGDGSAPSLQELTIDAPFANSTVTVRGIRLASATPTSVEPRYALHVDDAPGLFLFEDCVSADLPGQDAKVEWSGRAAFVRCAFRGDTGKLAVSIGDGTLPGPALTTLHTTQALYDCHLTGGTGAAAKQASLLLKPAQDGAYGVVFGWTLPGGDWTLVSRVTIEGGPGGAGLVTAGGACLDAGDGGTALFVTSLLRSAALDLVPGPPGSSSVGCLAATAGGELFLAPNGSIVPLPIEPPSLHVTGLLEPGQVAQLHYEGVPGQPVLLLVAGAPNLLWVPPAQSALGVSLDHRALLLGAADSAGELDLSMPVPAGVLGGLGSDEAIVLYLQAVAVAPGGFTLSNPTVVTILEIP